MIIGLCGLAGSGKDTVAKILRDRRGFASVSFAAPIYRAVAAITGLSVEELQDRRVKEAKLPWLDASPRTLLQTLGTEWGRDIVDTDIWIKLAMREAAGLRRAVLTDVRFANEARAVKDDGGVVWRVTRPAVVLDGEAAQHSSEAGLPDWLIDDVIDNDAGLDALAGAVEAAFTRLSAGTIQKAS